MRLCSTILLLLVLLTSEACSEGDSGRCLRLATTTSTRDSGLLDVLIPAFESEAGCRVEVVAVGSGAAIELGRSGDADVLLVHARSAEQAFMADGFAQRHEEFMENHFVFLGPENDPAGIGDLAPDQAFKDLASSGKVFVSRGDDSGTHKREKSLRALAGVEETWPGLIESGQGMGATLLMADEKEAYVLCDSATWSRFKPQLRLVPLIFEHELLRNPYSVMPVSPERHPAANADLAMRFADFLISTRAQELIRDFRADGHALFVPTRLEGSGR